MSFDDGLLLLLFDDDDLKFILIAMPAAFFTKLVTLRLFVLPFVVELRFKLEAPFFEFDSICAAFAVVLCSLNE